MTTASPLVLDGFALKGTVLHLHLSRGAKFSTSHIDLTRRSAGLLVSNASGLAVFARGECRRLKTVRYGQQRVTFRPHRGVFTVQCEPFQVKHLECALWPLMNQFSRMAPRQVAV